MNNDSVGIGLGVLLFLVGLLCYILTFTKQIPPEKKKLLTLSSLVMMIVGASLALLPYMTKLAQHSPAVNLSRLHCEIHANI